MMPCPSGGPKPVNPARLSPVSHRLWGLSLAAGVLAAGHFPAFGENPTSSPYRGLWAGQVTLNFVNEVPVPLDKNNNPVAPDPAVATPTFDQAHLRLILHVDGAGQVRLLRDVAVLNRAPSSIGTGVVDLKDNPQALAFRSSLLVRESDLSLLTDERLYAEFPPQPALRIASAVYDFGEDRATRAVESVIEEIALTAAAEILAGADPSDAESSAVAAATSNVLQRSNLSTEFDRFLREDMTRADVENIAVDSGTARQEARQSANQLQNWSPFFPDARGMNMVEAIVAAADSWPASDVDGRKKVALNTAAAHADLTDEYPRFIAGKQFGDMISSGAQAAGLAAVVPGATAGSISLAVRGNTAVRAAQTAANALDALPPSYGDSRAIDAFNIVVAAIVGKAAELSTEGSATSIALAAREAGVTALAERVARYLVPALGPTPDYTTFIKTPEYLGSPAVAAAAAVDAIIDALTENPFLDLDELTVIASDAAADALRAGTVNAFSKAAVANRRELPLQGEFGAGVGDPRFSYHIKKDRLAPLAPAELSGEMFLPAGHPTNPFRHRRHPDHKYGYDLTRRIRLDFDPGPAGSMERGGYGVSRISGVYREEISGLHKPLGQNKDLGLRVEGRFELNRISLIDALNAR